MSEAAYAGLLHQRRETMHARVVDAIEELYGDRIAEHVGDAGGPCGAGAPLAESGRIRAACWFIRPPAT